MGKYFIFLFMFASFIVAQAQIFGREDPVYLGGGTVYSTSGAQEYINNLREMTRSNTRRSAQSEYKMSENYRQKQIENQFASEIELMVNAISECIMSFVDNPYHHSNTVKINELMQECRKTMKDYQNKYWDLKISNTDLLYTIKNSLEYIDLVETLTGNIAQGRYVSLDATSFDNIFKPILVASGWTYKVISSDNYAIALEFANGKFKMLLLKNILPRDTKEIYEPGYTGNMIDYELYEYNAIMKKNMAYFGSSLMGNKYALIQYVDDEQKKQYYKTTKINSSLKKIK